MANSGKFELGHSRASKLKIDEVFEIREYYSKGATQRELAEHYGVSTVQVGRIVRGESWRMGAKAGRHQGTDAELANSQQRFLQMNGVRSPEELVEKLAKGLPPDSPDDFLRTPTVLGSTLSPEMAAKALAYGAVHTRTPPPSLLDGGEVGGEEEGAGVSKLVQEASKTPEAIDRMLKGEEE